MDIRSVARFASRLRRVVGSAPRSRAADGSGAQSRLGHGILSSGHCLQLPAFYGHNLPCVSHPRGLREIQIRHAARNRAAGAYGHCDARLAAIIPLALHSLYLLEPLALLRPELRAINDVRAAQRCRDHRGREALAAWRVCGVVPDAAGQLRNRRLGRSVDPFARIAVEIHSPLALGIRRGVHNFHVFGIPALASRPRRARRWLRR